MRECQQAIDLLKEQNISVELLDLRTVSPIDVDAIVESVKKTGRAVVVHEAQKTCGVGAEVIALINEHCLYYLEAPVERVTGYDIVVPLPKLEGYHIPDEKRIADAIAKVVTL